MLPSGSIMDERMEKTNAIRLPAIDVPLRRRVLWPVAFLLPLLLAVAWGPTFADPTYVDLRHAQNLANGLGIGENLSPLRFPLYTLVLATAALAGVDLAPVALLLSAVGWSMAGLMVYKTARQEQQPVGGLLALALLSFNPIILTTLGSAHPWAVAFAWLSLALALRPRPPERWQALALALLLATHPTGYNLTLALLLGIVFLRREKRVPWAIALAALGGLVLWGVANQWQPATLFPWQRPFFVASLLRESELYWLFLPLVGLGLWRFLDEKAPAALWGGLLWALLATATGSEAVFIVMVLFLAGTGAAWAAQQMVTRQLLQLSPARLMAIALLIAGAATGLAQFRSLQQRYQARLLAHWQLETQVGAWLRTTTPPAATVLSSQRIAFLAQRPSPALALDGISEARTLLHKLQEAPPDYLVAPQNLVWSNLSQMVWFRLWYEPVARFAVPGDMASPVTVWAVRAPLSLGGEKRPLNARIPDRFTIIGYQIWPQRIQPGDTVQMALFLQAPPATAVSATPFHAIIRLVSPADGSTQQEWEVTLPRSLNVEAWRPNQVIVEQFPLAVTAELPTGAYLFNLSLYGPDDPELWPIALDNDMNQLDRVALGTVAIPWSGTLAEVEGLQPVTATFGNQITLAGFTTSDPQAGQSLAVTLYWQAQQPVDAGYVVFVHLLDAAGQLIANHDSAPRNGRYPTTTWQPGEIIPDSHAIPLPVALPPGEYQLKVGLYLPQTGERLPVVTADGVEEGERAFLLQKITISY